MFCYNIPGFQFNVNTIDSTVFLKHSYAYVWEAKGSICASDRSNLLMHQLQESRQIQ